MLHPVKLILYILLSLLDLFLTYQLVQRSGGRFYEGNPIADAWLANYGWAGLALFKGLAVVLVASTAVLIGHYRPRAAGNVLAFGCLAVGSVVSYSFWLLRLC
jgi:hypothetical protein